MSSLEDLLVEEGFNRRKLRMSSRKSLGPESKNMQLVVSNVGPRRPGSAGSTSTVRRASRSRSDVAHFRPRTENVTNDKSKGPRSRNGSFSRLQRESKVEQWQNHERKGSRESMKAKKLTVVTVEETSGNEVIQTAASNEIIEVGLHEDEKYIEIFKNDVYSNDDDIEGPDDSRFQENGSYKPPPEKKILFDRKHSIILDENLPKDTSSNNNNKRSTKQAAENKKIQRQAEVDAPALDEAAILALISMLTSNTKRFLKDEDFRASLRHGCFESLNCTGHEHAHITESKAISNLENVIKIVERAADEENAASKELKKASLQLSLITGLNSNDMKDGYTSEIPNCKLSACAHVYLSVIFVLQKKDKVAAKHLLQALCDSPLQARTVLLDDPWDQIFSPHLTELNGWYTKETESLAKLSNKARKLKLLEKVYNEVLDSCTYQLASYYKDWLTEGVGPPLLPSVQIPPSIPFDIVEDEDQVDHSHEISSPSQPSLPITKQNLDDEQVFKHSTKTVSEVVECEEESFELSGKGSHFAALEENYSSETVNRAIADVKYDVSSHPEVEEEERPVLTSSLQKLSARDLLNFWSKKQETLGHMPTAVSPVPAQISEMILKCLGKGVFEQQHSGNSTDSARMDIFLLHDSRKTESGSPGDGDGDESGSCGSINDESFFSGIPPDFVCSLTELPFEDPVTLETGHTFERSAITKWFSRDNITCPVTKKTLECQSVPQSNSILKRVVDIWRSQYYNSLLDLTLKLKDCTESKDEISVFIIEQLLMASTEEERKRNAMQIINGGGLQFLVHKFRIGNLEEKTRISTILLSCIQVDEACKTYICVNIERSSLLNLLHSEQLKSRTSAVSLLIEIVCLKRRKDAKYFLEGMQREETLSAMHVLLMLLQNCEEEQRPQVAMLLLHFDLLGEPQNYSLYRGEAVDAITAALESSLVEEGVRENCCRALLVLGGHFSSAGKIMTEDWILKQAGFLHYQVYDTPGHEESSELVHDSVVTTVQLEDVDEEIAREKWLLNLSASLLGDGEKSFLEAISTCLMSQFPDLVRVCITTVAWLSSAIVSLSDAEFQLAAFSALLAGLIICLEHGDLVEHRVLASMSLLNFSKFPECRLLLMTMAEDIALSLESLTEVTWTAKELYATICS